MDKRIDSPEQEKNLTPMMKQFYEIKSKYKDHILFFRMGDFYEMFDEDAVIASDILGIVLTKRAGVRMCGVPFHSYKTYLRKLIDAGVKVVICEQLEDPKTAKGLVKRGVVEIITPGTITNEEFLDKENNFILQVYIKQEDKKDLETDRVPCFYYCTWSDLSTGEFFTTKFETLFECIDHIEKIKPNEIILSQSNQEEFPDFKEYLTEELSFDPHLSYSSVELNDRQSMEKLIRLKLGISSLESFGFEGDPGFTLSLGILVYYFTDNELGDLEYIRSIKKIHHEKYLKLDDQTRRNLEIFTPALANQKEYTLFKLLDKTCTPLGTRKLREIMLFPLRAKHEIEKRLDIISILLEKPEEMQKIREILKQVKDIERLFVKIFLHKAIPVDLVVFKSSIYRLAELSQLLEKEFNPLAWMIQVSPKIFEFADHIDKAINEEPPSGFDHGGIFRESYSDELLKVIDLHNNAENILLEYQNKIKGETNIQNLRIKYNKVFGYFIEVSKGNVSKVPESFIRKQTLTNNERYTTDFLIDLESKILSAFDRRIALEKSLFYDLCEEIKNFKIYLYEVFEQVAYLDVLANFTFLAYRKKWVKPVFNDEDKLIIDDGVHPVVSNFLKEEFIPNSLEMNKDNFFHLITGPNMSGKSTYLRQNALLIFMAHLGCFSPAKKISLPAFDQVFCRVGASDNLAKGQSTFLVEMIETANILNNASSRSFVILDEVGRGTATFDGMSLAYAISEYLIHQVKCKTLFATHYHELTHLANNEGVENYHTIVKEWEDKIVFLKKIEKGCADKSYGIYVAKIAGIPKPAIERAQELLKVLNENDIRFDIRTKKEKKQQFLFDSIELEKENILDSIQKFDIYNKTPLEAMQLIEKIQQNIKKIR